jgi:hypothetical protein
MDRRSWAPDRHSLHEILQSESAPARRAGVAMVKGAELALHMEIDENHL